LRTDFVIFLNYGMIGWLSKKQSTVGTSVFGTKFCIIKRGIENICGICFKLHMMGISIKRVLYVYSENMSVITNVIASLS
jgi:hypothetical protein